jgi:hypothetical protein
MTSKPKLLRKQWQYGVKGHLCNLTAQQQVLLKMILDHQHKIQWGITYLYSDEENTLYFLSELEIQGNIGQMVYLSSRLTYVWRMKTNGDYDLET